MGIQNGDDDTLVFSEQEKPEPSTRKDQDIKTHKLLIVDDEKEVHVMTKLVLADYSYMGASLQFLSAYSIPQAKALIQEHPDAACILLDVVMETTDAGLAIAKFIREDQQNTLLRIILRTGQPGKAPERDIILNYDINDYKEKTELTTQKLYTSITTALRSYLHLIELAEKQKEISVKNVRLNEEIARRIVAEHNLTKYNRSLEKMLDSKSTRLKESLAELASKEKELQAANKLAVIGDLSCSTIDQFEVPAGHIEQNLDTVNKYRSKMTLLLEKYEVLQQIIHSHANVPDSMSPDTHESLNDLNRFKEQIDIDQILKRYPEIIQDSARGIEHISRAINDIKLFISIDDEPQKPSDLKEILQSSIEQVHAQFDKRVDLQFSFDSLPQPVVTPQNMTRAFYEIIKNAFEAVPPNGIVSVTMAHEAPDIIIHISDIGCGIPSKDLENVFNPYFTRNKTDATKGLGLCYAKAVIKSNGGQINAISQANEGTTITITLPVEPPQ